MREHWPALLIAFIVAFTGGFLAYQLQNPTLDGADNALSSVVQVQGKLGGDFHLIRHDGVEVQASDFHGQYLLMYFGYSYCPDICPTSLIQMVRAVHQLPEKQQQAITPVFVTVDPVRDTPTEIAAYVADFDPRMVGLGGSVEQIQAMMQNYKVFARKTGAEEDIKNLTYLIDHSSFFYLIKPDGQFSHLFSSQITTEALTRSLTTIVQP
ncbi:MAG: SCO family protein [Alphaproteobacteria bacterium]|nr:SCO family protein [Alphaproteobacteria bacterium]